MIKSAHQYPVHALLSFESNVTYRVPPYQREYSWQKAQWEALFSDLVESGDAHFLGTIITLNSSADALAGGVLELVDGQQRATTVTLLLAAVHSVMHEHEAALDRRGQVEMYNLGQRLVRDDGTPRVTPQTQNHNLDDYRTVLVSAGLSVSAQSRKPYFTARRISRCFQYFRSAITTLAESDGTSDVEAARRLLTAAQNAVLVKIEVATHADAFVLFESLNNRGMPLTPVDLIKTHLLAESERRSAMGTDDAFALWNEMLTNLGDNYPNQERFLRHYYNAFRTDLPSGLRIEPVATRSKLIRIYETLLGDDVKARTDDLVDASRLYGRITCAVETDDDPTPLDAAFRRLMRAQGAPSYILLLWLLRNQGSAGLSDTDLGTVVRRLISFFVRRNLTGFPQTYALPKLFMTTIDRLRERSGSEVVAAVTDRLVAESSTDEEFRRRLVGPIYEENADVARFLLTTLVEDDMTRENRVDLWAQEKGRYVWTIEHILPQGANLPQAWRVMLGGAEAAAAAQQTDVHTLGNLTITAYNSTLGNKSFREKRDRTDSDGHKIGYNNGLGLNSDLAARDSWTVPDIVERTARIAAAVMARFPLA